MPAWMPLKFVAKWRNFQAKDANFDNLVLCGIHESGGHFGYSQVQKTKRVTKFLDLQKSVQYFSSRILWNSVCNMQGRK